MKITAAKEIKYVFDSNEVEELIKDAFVKQWAPDADKIVYKFEYDSYYGVVFYVTVTTLETSL